MDKTYRTELRRVFLLADLPAPLTRASEHLQFFDNYIENTRMRLRSIRAPHTKQWFWILEQRIQVEENDFSRWQISEILLNEKEHAAFEIFEGREVRKNERVETNEVRFNRYSFDTNSYSMMIDFFLNPLWGLILAKVFFQTEAEMQAFVQPGFAVAEITQNEMFSGKNLIGNTISDIQTTIKELEFET